MAVVGSVSVLLTASTDTFRAGLQAAASSLDAIKGSAASTGTSLLGLGAIAAGSVAGMVTAALGGMWAFKKLTEGIVETSHEAKTLGLTTGALQELQYAAKKSGIDADGMTSALMRMNARLGEVATTGTGKAAQALARFGINARQLAQSGTDAAFTKITTVAAAMKNPMERAAFLVDVFGKSGYRLSGLLGEGTAGIQKLREEARRLGVAMSEADVQVIKLAYGAVGRLASAMQGAKNQLLVAIAPVVQALAENLQTGVGYGIRAFQMLGTALQPVVEVIRVALAPVAAMFQQMGGTVAEGLMSTLGSAFQTVGGYAAQIAAYTIAAVQSMYPVFLYVRDLILSWSEAFLQWSGVTESSTNRVTQAWDLLGLAVAKVADVIDTVKAAFLSFRADFLSGLGVLASGLAKFQDYAAGVKLKAGDQTFLGGAFQVREGSLAEMILGATGDLGKATGKETDYQAFFKNFAEELDKAAAKDRADAANAGKGQMKNSVQDWFKGVGKDAQKTFDDAMANLNRPRPPTMPEAPEAPKPFSKPEMGSLGTGAALALGSKESLVSMLTAKLGGNDVQQQQLAEQKAMAKALANIDANTKKDVNPQTAQDVLAA